MSSILVEVRAAEGGADAKLLVHEQVSIYARYCKRQKLTLTVLSQLPGQTTLKVDGPGDHPRQAFRHEGGGHRWQRVPPTEKKGRVHTSTITVAVMPLRTAATVRIDPADVEFKTCRGSGAGGQHRNVTDSAVQAKHLPTGLTVRCENERSQHQNKAQAMAILQARLGAHAEAQAGAARSQNRKKQVGSGMRGDKRRTVRVQADQVVDHKTGRRMTVKRYMRGEVEGLQPPG